MLGIKHFRSVLNTLVYGPPKPILPPELEREIFELAATTYPECAVRLVLVAHRTLIWIEPLLYETVVLGRFRSGEVDQFLRTVRSRPAHFLATCVKSLVLTNVVDVDQAVQIMSVCTGIVNVASWVPSTTIIPAMVHLRPQKLSLNLKSRRVVDPDFTHPLFANVTHLEFVDQGSSWTMWSGFDNLRSLTHLALGFEGDARMVDLIFVLHQILASCSSLEVFVILAHNDHISRATLDLVQDNFPDPRVVFLREEPHLRDWLGGLRGEQDMWARAKHLVMVQSGAV